MSRALRIAVNLSVALLCARPARSQQLGNKLLGSVGIDAGVQSPPGLFIIDRYVGYGAHKIRDRNGNVVPIDGLDIDAKGNAIGLSYTLLTSHAQYLSFALSAPIASIDISRDEPGASVSGYGFSDLFLQPLKLGWREGRFDLVTAYMIYVPTGKFEPLRGSVGRGYWTHELSLGGAVYFDSTRTGRASLLASYDRNTRMRHIDIQRGNMFQIQGGAGAGVGKIAVVGVAGYALWQVTRDRGAQIPPPLLGQWSRVFGLGPELGVLIPMLRARADIRYESEFGVRSRQQGHVFSVGLAYLASHKPKPPK